MVGGYAERLRQADISRAALGRLAGRDPRDVASPAGLRWRYHRDEAFPGRDEVCMVAVVPSSRIRNVALVGHDGSGKTTLAEALLVATKAVPRRGRVEEGTTVCDVEPEELRHHASLSTAIAPVLFGDFKLNLLDTPGLADFRPEAETALAVADLVVVVVSAVDGVQVGTRALWRLAASLGLPRMIFVNKLDRERADFERTLDELRDAFGSGIAPLELPIGAESSFRGVVDLLTDVATVYEAGAARQVPVPEDMATREHRVHDNLVEGIVVADDALMTRYLDGDTPSAPELEVALATGIASATVFPVVCGSATAGIGLERLMTLACEVPTDRRATAAAGDARVEIVADPDGEPLARVVKTVADPFVGRISVLQVVSGTLRPDMVLVNTRSHAEERLHVLETIRGKELAPVTEAQAGDLVAVPKLGSSLTGDTLAPKATPVVLDPLPRSPVMLAIAVRPRTTGDEDKMMTALHRLVEEDPSLEVRRDDETHQTVLSGMGETHLAVTLERLARKCGVEVDQEEVLVPYRETVSGPGEAEGRHKKQTGGHGQFAVVHLRVEPTGRGEGFVFVDAVVGGAIPRQFIPAVEKGVRRQMHQGGTWGFPVVDVRVTCDGGKFHPVDSSEMSFELAGAAAFAAAIDQAGATPLEPVSRVEVTVPAAHQGDVLGDLTTRRGRVVANETTDDGEQVVVAEVPTAELGRYAVDLRALTGGQGRFVAHFDHYAEVSAQVTERLLRRRTVTV
jgi:elongation factor G